MDQEIEYLDEYKDLILPRTIRPPIDTKPQTNQNNMNRSKSPDSDSSSIDQDIFETLFDNISDDDMLRKDDSNLLAHRSKRDSLDSIDALVQDLGAQVAKSAATKTTNISPIKPKVPPIKKITPALPPPLPAKKLIANRSALSSSEKTSSIRTAPTKPPSTVIREKGRPVATIVRPEKIVSKDPVEDPLKLDEDLGQLSLSEVSSDSSDTLNALKKGKRGKEKPSSSIDPSRRSETPSISATKSSLPEKVKIISNTPLKPIDKEVIKSISSKKDTILSKVNDISKNVDVLKTYDCDVIDALLGTDPIINELKNDELLKSSSPEIATNYDLLELKRLENELRSSKDEENLLDIVKSTENASMNDNSTKQNIYKDDIFDNSMNDDEDLSSRNLLDAIDEILSPNRRSAKILERKNLMSRNEKNNVLSKNKEETTKKDISSSLLTNSSHILLESLGRKSPIADKLVLSKDLNSSKKHSDNCNTVSDSSDKAKLSEKSPSEVEENLEKIKTQTKLSITSNVESKSASTFPNDSVIFSVPAMPKRTKKDRSSSRESTPQRDRNSSVERPRSKTPKDKAFKAVHKDKDFAALTEDSYNLLKPFKSISSGSSSSSTSSSSSSSSASIEKSSASLSNKTESAFDSLKRLSSQITIKMKAKDGDKKNLAVESERASPKHDLSKYIPRTQTASPRHSEHSKSSRPSSKTSSISEDPLQEKPISTKQKSEKEQSVPSSSSSSSSSKKFHNQSEDILKLISDKANKSFDKKESSSSKSSKNSTEVKTRKVVRNSMEKSRNRFGLDRSKESKDLKVETATPSSHFLATETSDMQASSANQILDLGTIKFSKLDPKSLTLEKNFEMFSKELQSKMISSSLKRDHDSISNRLSISDLSSDSKESPKSSCSDAITKDHESEKSSRDVVKKVTKQAADSSKDDEPRRKEHGDLFDENSVLDDMDLFEPEPKKTLLKRLTDESSLENATSTASEESNHAHKLVLSNIKTVKKTAAVAPSASAKIKKKDKAKHLPEVNKIKEHEKEDSTISEAATSKDSSLLSILNTNDESQESTFIETAEEISPTTSKSSSKEEFKDKEELAPETKESSPTKVSTATSLSEENVMLQQDDIPESCSTELSFHVQEEVTVQTTEMQKTTSAFDSCKNNDELFEKIVSKLCDTPDTLAEMGEEIQRSSGTENEAFNEQKDLQEDVQKEQSPPVFEQSSTSGLGAISEQQFAEVPLAPELPASGPLEEVEAKPTQTTKRRRDRERRSRRNGRKTKRALSSSSKQSSTSTGEQPAEKKIKLDETNVANEPEEEPEVLSNDFVTNNNPSDDMEMIPNLRKEIFGTTDTDTDGDRSNSSTPIPKKKVKRASEIDKLLSMAQEINDKSMQDMIKQKMSEALSEQSRNVLAPQLELLGTKSNTEVSNVKPPAKSRKKAPTTTEVSPTRTSVRRRFPVNRDDFKLPPEALSQQRRTPQLPENYPRVPKLTVKTSTMTSSFVSETSPTMASAISPSVSSAISPSTNSTVASAISPTIASTESALVPSTVTQTVASTVAPITPHPTSTPSAASTITPTVSPISKTCKVRINRRPFNNFIKRLEVPSEQDQCSIVSNTEDLAHLPFELKTSPQLQLNSSPSTAHGMSPRSMTKSPEGCARTRNFDSETAESASESIVPDNENEGSLLTALRSEPVLDTPQTHQTRKRGRKRKADSFSLSGDQNVMAPAPAQQQQQQQQQQMQNHQQNQLQHQQHQQQQQLKQQAPTIQHHQQQQSRQVQAIHQQPKPTKSAIVSSKTQQHSSVMTEKNTSKNDATPMPALLPPKEEQIDPDDPESLVSRSRTETTNEGTSSSMNQASATAIRVPAANETSSVVAHQTCGSKAIYNFLYPAKFHPSCGNVLLDFCCPDLEGPLTAVNPARLHSQLKSLILELPSLIVLTTKLITKEELHANKNFVPASVRQKLQRSNQFNQKANTQGVSSMPSLPPGPSLQQIAQSPQSVQVPVAHVPPNELSSSSLAMRNKISQLKTRTMPDGRSSQANAQGMASSLPISNSVSANTLRRLDSMLLKLSHLVLTASFPERQRAIEALATSNRFSSKDYELVACILEEYEEILPSKIKLPTTNTVTSTTTNHQRTKAVQVAPEAPPSAPPPSSSMSTNKNPQSSMYNVPIYDSNNTIIGYQLKVTTSGPGNQSSPSLPPAGAPSMKAAHKSASNKEPVYNTVQSNQRNVATTSMNLKYPAQTESPKVFYSKAPNRSSTSNAKNMINNAALQHLGSNQMQKSVTVKEIPGVSSVASGRKRVRFSHVTITEPVDLMPAGKINTHINKIDSQRTTQSPITAGGVNKTVARTAPNSNPYSKGKGSTNSANVRNSPQISHAVQKATVKTLQEVHANPSVAGTTPTPKARQSNANRRGAANKLVNNMMADKLAEVVPPAKTPRRRQTNPNTKAAAPTRSRRRSKAAEAQQLIVVTKDLLGGSCHNEDEECILPDEPNTVPAVANHIKYEDSDDDFIGGI